MPGKRPVGLVTRGAVAAALTFGAVKGITVATATFLIGTSFGQSVLVALLSGTLGIVGMMGAAWYTGKQAQRTRAEVEKARRDIRRRRRNTREEDK